MQRGLDIHKQFEDFTQGVGPVPDFPYFGERITNIYLDAEQQQSTTFSELELWLTSDWEPAFTKEQKTGTCILDLLQFKNGQILVIDYKTGKPNPIGHTDQSNIYAIAAHIHYPEYPEIRTEFWYLDQDKITTHIYHPPAINKIKLTLQKRVEKMLTDDFCTPSPNKYKCKFCNYRDHCEYKC